MDYCSSCRRHLNGALVCPGCGAYAPDIAPPTDGAPYAGPAAGFTGHGRGTEDPYPGPDAEVTEGGRGTEDPHADPAAAEVADVPPAPRGRAARRRQLARWKKGRRRAAVATAVAIVGGGLSIATMDRNSADRAQAAAAPDHRSMGVAEERATEPTRPAPVSTPSTPRRPAHTTGSTAHSPATGLPRQQSLPAVPRTAPVTRRDTAVPPRRDAPSTPQPRTTARSAAGTAPDHTATEPGPAPATTTGSGTDSGAGAGSGTGTSTGTGSGTRSGTSGTAPAPASASSTQLCLVVVCLG